MVQVLSVSSLIGQINHKHHNAFLLIKIKTKEPELVGPGLSVVYSLLYLFSTWAHITVNNPFPKKSAGWNCQMIMADYGEVNGSVESIVDNHKNLVS